MKCRICGTSLEHTFIDLGVSPIANEYIKKEELNKKENYFPLHTYICNNCFLVQLDVFETPKNIFSEYAYFSSYSTSWLDHCKKYCKEIKERLNLDGKSQVIEIASNDGYLLQYFMDMQIKVIGIEPANNVAKKAREKGIPTICDFFGEDCVKKLQSDKIVADLIIANNVLAHIPDVNEVIKGIKKILGKEGVFTAEFPHLLQLIKNNQYDTIYHEHFSYFSFKTIQYLLSLHELKIFDVDILETHGGSLRIYATHTENNEEVSANVGYMCYQEENIGMNKMEFYKDFKYGIYKLKMEVLKDLIEIKNNNKSIVAYGAPAKGNTMLNFCGIGKEFIDYTVDLNPHKQGLYLPGSRLQIYSPNKIRETKPNYILILPWNLKDEISEQLSFTREWGCKFITLIPNVNIW